MTLEEAIVAAQNGDENAAIKLAEYYENNNEYHKAAEWYDFVADRGNMLGIMCSISIHNRFGRVSTYAFAQGIEEWDRVIDLCTRVMNSGHMNYPFGDGTIADEIYSSYDEAVYLKSACYFFNNQFDEILSMPSEDLHSQHMDDSLKILRCTAVTRITKINSEFEVKKLSEIADILNKYIGVGSRYKPGYATIQLPDNLSAMQIQEAIYSVAIVFLSFGYSMLKSNPTQGYEIVVNALNRVRSQNAKESLNENLAHYRKKLFGGYEYIQ